MSHELQERQKRSAEEESRENSFAPRWEIREMIRQGVAAGISDYEMRVVAPRHAETQNCLGKIDGKLDGLRSTADQQIGGIAMLKYLLGGGGIMALAGLIITVFHYVKP